MRYMDQTSLSLIFKENHIIHRQRNQVLPRTIDQTEVYERLKTH